MGWELGQYSPSPAYPPGCHGMQQDAADHLEGLLPINLPLPLLYFIHGYINVMDSKIKQYTGLPQKCQDAR